MSTTVENRIILPHEVKDVEGLRKSLRALVTPPEVKQFEVLKSQGFDSETAAELSGLR